MANPITWQNVLGPSLADASRPLEAAQRTFSGMFDGLGTMLRDAETRQEVGRNLTKDRNRDTILDLYANAKTPEQVADAQQQEAALRAQFGDMLRSGDVRGADERRLVDVRNQTKQGMEFDTYLKDERSKPFVEAYRAAAIKKDAIGMANAEAAYTQAGGPKLSALIEYGDQRDRLGLERAEEDKTWVRNQGEYDDKLKSSDVQRRTSLSQAQSSRISANAASSNAATSRKQFELGVNKEIRDANKDAVELQAKLTEKIGKVGSYSPTSREGAQAIADEKAKFKDETTQRMVTNVSNRLIKEGASVGTVLAGINAVRPEDFWTTESSIENDAYKAAMANAPAAQEQVKSANFQRGRYVEQGEQAAKDAAQVEAQLRALLPGARTAPAPVPVGRDRADVFRNNTFANERPGTPEHAALTQALQQDETRLVAERQKQMANPAYRLASAEQRLKDAATAGKGKGYYTPEALEWRRAEEEAEDARSVVRESTEKTAEKRNESLQRIKAIENRFNVLTKEAAKFTSKDRPVPANVSRLLEQDGEDLKILKERLGIK